MVTPRKIIASAADERSLWVLTRTVTAEVPVRIDYALTPLRRDLVGNTIRRELRRRRAPDRLPAPGITGAAETRTTDAEAAADAASAA